MRHAWLFVIAIVVGASAHADDGATARHLMAGVRAFKDGRYEEALVELRVVARAPDAPPDLAFYLGPTLVQLGRDAEAIDVFLASDAARDDLTDFYFGEAYYHLRLYRKARAVFAGLRSQGLGPVLDEGAARYVASIDAVYAQPPGVDTVEYYVKEANERDSDPLIAAELLDEARLVEQLSTDHHRHGEIVDALAAMWNRAGRATNVVELLAPERALSEEATWQLARAYASKHDSAHATPLLHAIVKSRGAHASEAAALRVESASP